MASASVAVAEAQRLIAMSLGKIAASRTQRGGINLHRNLLVAGVLHKAKTAYMIENYHIMAARKQQQQQQQAAAQAHQEQQQQLQMMSAQVNPSPCPTPGPSAVSRVTPLPLSHAAASAAAPAPAQTGDTPPPPARQEPGSENGSSSPRLVASCPAEAVEEVSMQDKENTPPSSFSAPAACSKEEDAASQKSQQLSERLSPMENQDYTSGAAASSCGRCVLKRRSSSSVESESSSPKKARLGESQDAASSCENLSWGSPAPSPLAPAVEAMQVDPPQISNLVNIFNAGLSGLCSSQSSDSSDSSASHSLLAGFSSRSQRVMDAASLLCGSQAMDSRMDSGPQAIALTV